MLMTFNFIHWLRLFSSYLQHTCLTKPYSPLKNTFVERYQEQKLPLLLFGALIRNTSDFLDDQPCCCIPRGLTHPGEYCGSRPTSVLVEGITCPGLFVFRVQGVYSVAIGMG